MDGWGGVLLGASSASTAPGGPGPPVRNTVTGRLVIVGHVKVVHRTKLRVRVACRGPAVTRCAGRLTLLIQTGKGRHRRKVGVGGLAIKLRGGHSVTITMGLDARGRKLLTAAHRLRVRMAITQGKRSVLNRQYTLRHPVARHKKRRAQGPGAGASGRRREGERQPAGRHGARPLISPDTAILTFT